MSGPRPLPSPQMQALAGWVALAASWFVAGTAVFLAGTWLARRIYGTEKP